MSGTAGCCARAASGHDTAVPSRTVTKSRRLMASPPPRTTSGIKEYHIFDRELCRSFASQRDVANVRFGSKADIALSPTNVRFTPKSGHRSRQRECPLCTTSGLMHRTKQHPKRRLPLIHICRISRNIRFATSTLLRSRFYGGLWLHRRSLTPDLHVRAGSVLDRLELAAADGARRYRVRILGAKPVKPVRPPRACMFGGLGQPFINIRARRFRPVPVLIFMQIGRIDNAGDMSGPGEHELHRPAEILRTVQHGFGRRDVILLGGETVDRNLDLAQVELDAAQLQFAPCEFVV